jgi:chaperone LolA
MPQPPRSWRPVAQATVLCLLGIAGARGQTAVAAREPLLDRYLEHVHTLSANFTQTLIDADGAVIEDSSGTLEVSRPGRFRWVYRQPYEQWLVADGVNVWSYDVDLAQVTVKDQSAALASTPALLLGGSTDVLEEFRYEGTASEGGLTWVRLAPLDDESGFRHVELGFSGEQLSRMVFRDNLDQTTVVTLTDVEVNEAIEPGAFEFVVPEHVDVVGTPAEATPDPH